MNDGQGSDIKDLRDYLFDMLAQLAKVAEKCDEVGIAMVLNTIVVSWKTRPKRQDEDDPSNSSVPPVN